MDFYSKIGPFFKSNTKLCLSILFYLVLNFWLEGRISFYRLAFLALLGFFVFYLPVSFKWEKAKWILGISATIWLHIFFFSWPELSGPDAKGFWTIAHGNTVPMELAMYRPKLYPWFLMLAPNLKAVAIYQLLLKGGIFLCMYLAARLLGWKNQIILFCFLLFSLNTLWLREPMLVSDTTLFSFCLMGAFTGFVWHIKEGHLKSLTLFALFAGLASLCRQVMDPILIFCLLILVGYKLSAKKFLALGLFLALIDTGAFYNYLQFGIAKRSIALGVNLYTHSSFYALQQNPELSQKFLKDCENFAGQIPHIWDVDYKKYVSHKANALPHEYQQCLEKKGLSRIESDRYLKHEFFNWIMDNTSMYMYSIYNEWRRMLVTSGEYYPPKIFFDYHSHFPGSEELKRVERQISYYPLWWLLATLGFLLLNVKGSGFGWLGLSVLGISLAYTLLISAIHIGFTRYSLPIIPLLVFAIGQGLNGLVFKKP